MANWNNNEFGIENKRQPSSFNNTLKGNLRPGEKNFKVDKHFITALDGLTDPWRSTKWRMFIPGNIANSFGFKYQNMAYTDKEEITDFLALNINSFKIPDLSFDTEDVSYMGFKKTYITNVNNLNGSTDLSVVLYQDMVAYEAFHAWQQSCYNVGVLGGSNNRTPLSSYNSDGKEVTGLDVDLANFDRVTDWGLPIGLGTHKDIIGGVGGDNNNRANVEMNVRNGLSYKDTVRVELYDWSNGRPLIDCIFYNAFPETVGGIDGDYDNASIKDFNVTLHYDYFKINVYQGGSNLQIKS